MENDTQGQNGRVKSWLLLLFHWKHRVTVVLLKPKITLRTNVCAEAGAVTEDASSHMCREITVKAAGPVTKKCVCVWVCLGGSTEVLWEQFVHLWMAAAVLGVMICKKKEDISHRRRTKHYFRRGYLPFLIAECVNRECGEPLETH